jgi:hypothetical protein
MRLLYLICSSGSKSKVVPSISTKFKSSIDSLVQTRHKSLRSIDIVLVMSSKCLLFKFKPKDRIFIKLFPSFPFFLSTNISIALQSKAQLFLSALFSIQMHNFSGIVLYGQDTCWSSVLRILFKTRGTKGFEYFTVGLNIIIVNPILCLQKIRRDGETGLLLRLHQLLTLQNSCCVPVCSQHSWRKPSYKEFLVLCADTKLQNRSTVWWKSGLTFFG